MYERYGLSFSRKISPTEPAQSQKSPILLDRVRRIALSFRNACLPGLFNPSPFLRSLTITFKCWFKMGKERIQHAQHPFPLLGYSLACSGILCVFGCSLGLAQRQHPLLPWCHKHAVWHIHNTLAGGTHVLPAIRAFGTVPWSIAITLFHQKIPYDLVCKMVQKRISNLPFLKMRLFWKCVHVLK